MELIKKNIHMDHELCKADTQVTVEDDKNVPDNKPDMESIVLNQGYIRIEETKSLEDKAQVNGTLIYSLLYISQDEQRIELLEGSIPFQEQIYMDGLHGNNSIRVKSELEDLTTNLINSRKYSVQAVLTLSLCVDDIEDEETTVDISFTKEELENGGSPLEYRKKITEISELAIEKKDVLRIKEEVSIPQDFPNILELLWKDMEISIPEIKAQEEKIALNGILKIFVLYRGEGEEHPVRWYETSIPVSTEIDCHGCTETMIPDISFDDSHREIDVRPDLDGEERVIGVEIPMDLTMKLYQQDTLQILSDVYGIHEEVNAITKDGQYKNLLIRNSGKFTVHDTIKIDAQKGRILQICYCNGKAEIEEIVENENGIELQGSVSAQVLYVTNEDENPFASTKATIPFTYQLEVPNLIQNCEKKIQLDIMESTASMIDSETVDIFMGITVQAMVFEPIEEKIITQIQTNELDLEIQKGLPGIVVYVVKPSDSLWKIGKKYYISVEQIKKLNNLTSDVIYPGDKLVLVKNISL